MCTVVVVVVVVVVKAVEHSAGRRLSLFFWKAPSLAASVLYTYSQLPAEGVQAL